MKLFEYYLFERYIKFKRLCIIYPYSPSCDASFFSRSARANYLLLKINTFPIKIVYEFLMQFTHFPLILQKEKSRARAEGDGDEHNEARRRLLLLPSLSPPLFLFRCVSLAASAVLCVRQLRFKETTSFEGLRLAV